MPAHKKTYLISSVVTILFAWFVLVPFASGANPPTPPPPTKADYYPLVGIPGLQGLGTNTSTVDYINAIYILIISVGALIGVLKIAFAGVKYSMSDVITDKASAKKDIMGVLLGLAILLIPFIVLNTIYPGLTKLDVLDVGNKIQLLPRSGSTNTQSTMTIPPGTVPEECGYDQIYDANCIFSQQNSLEGGTTACPPTGWNDSACRAKCSQKGGTFYPANERSGSCYVPKNQVTTVDGTTVDQDMSAEAKMH